MVINEMNAKAIRMLEQRAEERERVQAEAKSKVEDAFKRL